MRDTFRAVRRRGVAFTIATDGPEMMQTHLRDEFELLERIGALDETSSARRTPAATRPASSAGAPRWARASPGSSAGAVGEVQTNEAAACAVTGGRVLRDDRRPHGSADGTRSTFAFRFSCVSCSSPPPRSRPTTSGTVTSPLPLETLIRTVEPSAPRRSSVLGDDLTPGWSEKTWTALTSKPPRSADCARRPRSRRRRSAPRRSPASETPIWTVAPSSAFVPPSGDWSRPRRRTVGVRARDVGLEAVVLEPLHGRLERVRRRSALAWSCRA